MRIKKTHHFLVVEDDGRCRFLAALPGQTLRGEEVSPRVLVRCDRPGFLARAHPAGTVFGTTTLRKARKGMASFYAVKDLHLLSGEDSSPDLFASSARDELLEEYGQFRAAQASRPPQERKPDNKLR